jgi:hypothetical protein
MAKPFIRKKQSNPFKNVWLIPFVFPVLEEFNLPQSSPGFLFSLVRAEFPASRL